MSPVDSTVCCKVPPIAPANVAGEELKELSSAPWTLLCPISTFFPVQSTISPLLFTEIGQFVVGHAGHTGGTISVLRIYSSLFALSLLSKGHCEVGCSLDLECFA